MNANHMTIGFIGLGLIGGSIAKTIRRIHPDSIIYGFDTDIDSLKMAKEDGTLTQYFETLDPTFSSCDIIFLCAPVSNNIEYLKELKGIISESCLLTDVGSVKEPIQSAIKELGMESNFIGGHPMCGSEKTGFFNATEYLLENAYYIITPTAKTTPAQLEEFHALVKSLGSVPMILDYEKHDFATAAISHLPHIIASSLVNLVSDLDDEQETMRTIAAGGFKDITRIASSSPVMWQNICLSNQEQILKLTDCYIHALQNIRSSVADAKSDDIISFFQSAKDYRDSITTPVRGSLQKNYSVYCDLVDEAGAIATLATIMASHNISIKNIGILHNREYEDGVLQIEFYEEDALEKAVKLMEDNHYVVHRR